MKSVRIRSYSGPYFSAFGLNTDQNNSEYGHFCVVGGRVKRTASIAGFSSQRYVRFHLQFMKSLKRSKFKYLCFNEASDERPALKGLNMHLKG